MSVCSEISDQAVPPCSDSEEAMAEQPPAKKARTEFQVPPFTAVELNGFSLKEKARVRTAATLFSR